MRHGGVSPVPWKSLNLGGSNGDLRENVIENRKRIFNKLSKPVATLFDVWQVHSDTVVHVKHPRPFDEEQIKADALLTNKKEVTLFMRFADCVPVFLYDPMKQVVGMVHAGWQGTVKQIVRKAIQEMLLIYDCRPKDIIAGIGPSICVHHYEIGQDVVQHVIRFLGAEGVRSLVSKNGNIHFDLQHANFLQLKDAGLTQIEQSGVCTACDVNNWFSHRAEKGKTGRMGALIAL